MAPSGVVGAALEVFKTIAKQWGNMPTLKQLCLLTMAGAIAGHLTLVGPALAETDSRSVEYYEDALERLNKGEVRAAVIQLKNALQRNPDYVEARFKLGTTYLLLGDGASAEKELKAALARGHDEQSIVVPMGRAYLLQNKNHEVLDEIQSGARGDEIEADVLLIRGTAQLNLRQVEEAENAFLAADQLRPDHAPTKVGLARIQLARGKLAEAEAEADAALELAPDLQQALLLKGELRRFARDPEGALKHFETAIKIAPRSLLARLGRAATLADLNRDEDAREEIKAIREIDPNNALASYLSALVLAKKGDNAGAQVALLEAGTALDDYAPAIFLRGVVTYALGHFEQAESSLRRYLVINPRHLLARKILGATLIRKREAEAAEEVLRPGLNFAPDDAQLHALYGNALMQLGRYQEATSHFEQAASADPDAAAVQTQLALGRLATGESDQAVAALQSALEKDPEASQPGILLALTHLRSRKYDEALEAIDRFEDREPNNPLPQNLRGAALLGKGDIEAARASFEKALEIQPDFFPALNNLAQIDYRLGETERAKARYLKYIETHDKPAPAMIAMADLAERERRAGDAIDWLEKARQSDAKALVPRLRLVNAYIAREEPEKALSVGQELSQLDPANPLVLDALGRAQLAAGEPKTAVGTFRRLLSQVPNSAEGFRRLSQAQLAADDVAGARASLEEAISVSPNHLPAYAALVALELDNGRPKEALAVAESFREKNANSPSGEILLGDALVRSGRYREAAKAYEAGLSKGESTQLAIRLHEARVKAGDEAAAIQGLAGWVDGHPDDRAAQLVLAGAYIRAGQHDTAIEHYERLDAVDGRNPIVVNNLAWLYQSKGDPRALEYAERALELAPDSPSIMDTLGWILVQRGDPQRALPLLEKAKARLTDQPDVLYHYAAALHRLGRSDEAKPYLRNLLTLYGEFESAPAAKALLDEISKGN